MNDKENKDKNPISTDDGEIEVTPEMVEDGLTPSMIAAGLAAYFSYDDRFEAPEEAVARVYLSMASLDPHKGRGRSSSA